MSERPRLLDLFSGAGGAAMGYHRAGFEVVGVDIAPQPHYPFPFVQADAIAFMEDGGWRGFDAIHASPPCQPFTRAGHLMRAQGHTTRKADLVAPTRKRLIAAQRPWVMENVPGSPMLNPLMLCGSMFELRVQRHRWFESDHLIFGPGPCRHAGKPIGVWGRKGDRVPHGGHTARTLEEGQAAMGIDWMPWARLVEAIPPAYTEWIGTRLLEVLRAAA